MFALVRRWLLLHAVFLSVSVASSFEPHERTWHASHADTRTPQDIMVDVVNDLGLNILKIHNTNNENNIALSPYGVASILTALLEGVRGRAALEIQKCGGFPADRDVIRVGLRDIHRLLRSYFIPQEGFLSGLSLSSEKVTLKPEYQSILRFYGFDMTSFNTPIYPNLETTTPMNNNATMSDEETTTETTTQTTTEEITTMPTTLPTMTLPSTMPTMTTTPKEETTTMAPETTLPETTVPTTTIPTTTDGITTTEKATTMFTSTEEIGRTTPEITTTLGSTTNEPTTTSLPDTTTQTTMTRTTRSVETTLTTVMTTVIDAGNTGTTTFPSTTDTTTFPTTLTTKIAETTTFPTTLTTRAAETTTFPTTIEHTTFPTTPETTTFPTTLTTKTTETTTIPTTLITRATETTTFPTTIEHTTFPTTPETTTFPTATGGETTTFRIRRIGRSIVDYFIARYYDDQTPDIYNEPINSKKHTFLVNGKYQETHVHFMTYDAVLPFYYVHNLNALALRFPLDSPKYYLLLLLPVDEEGIDKLVCDIGNAVTLKQIVSHLRPTYVRAVIPSFMLRGFVILTSSLQKIGIRQIFEPRHTDFSAMTDDKDIYVTNIEQAITVMIKNYMDPTMINKNRNLYQYGPVEFKATHPFLYFVMDSEIDVTLVAGKIVNPINSRIQ